MVRQAKLDRTNRMKTMTMQAIACAVAMGCMGGFAAEYFVLKDGGSDGYDGKAAANVRVTGFGPARRKAVDPVSGRVISEAADSVAGLSVDVPPEDVRLIVFKKQTK